MRINQIGLWSYHVDTDGPEPQFMRTHANTGVTEFASPENAGEFLMALMHASEDTQTELLATLTGEPHERLRN